MIHRDFIGHMLGHLLFGMLAPLLIVLSAPMSLLLRSIPTQKARRLTSLLKSKPIQLFTDPLVVSLLHIGGLWLLYCTQLFSLMQQNQLLYLLVHIHIFWAGYLFTTVMLQHEPIHHRSFFYRGFILILAIGAHSILAKYIYAFPPMGVNQSEAELGGQLMYYGGDMIDSFLMLNLFYQWYRKEGRMYRRGVYFLEKSIIVKGENKKGEGRPW